MIKDKIIFLEQIKYQVAELLNMKAAIEKELQEYFHKDKDGQTTYAFERWNVEITTGWNYKLNKKKYAEWEDMITPRFNPIKETVKLEINKKIYRECEEFGSDDDRLALSEFTSKSEKKLNVKITPGC